MIIYSLYDNDLIHEYTRKVQADNVSQNINPSLMQGTHIYIQTYKHTLHQSHIYLFIIHSRHIKAKMKIGVSPCNGQSVVQSCALLN